MSQDAGIFERFRVAFLARKRSLALISGALAALGHAPFGLWPIALFGFVVLTWTVTHAAKPWQGFGRAWWGGVGYFAATLHWIVEPFLVDVATHGWMAPGALVLMAGGMALFWGLAGWLAVWVGGARSIAFAATLTLAELARGHVLTGFPWAMPAYIWTDTDVRLAAAFVGPYGLTFLTLLVAALPSLRGKIIDVAVLSFAIALVPAVLPLAGTDAPVESRTVVMVQPNAPQDEKWDPVLAHGFIDLQIDYTREGVAQAEPDMVVWSEAAIVYALERAGPVLAEVAEAAGGVPVLTGINRRDGEDWYNSAALIEGGGQVTETYDKVHLVPFGEYIPGRIDLLRAMAARSDYGFRAGDKVRTIETPLGQALVLICYEVIFPGHIRQADSRPDVLIQITNDAWFGTFAGPFQHLQQARFRAVEQGLPLVRVANVGVNAMIDPHGEITAVLPFGEAGWLEGSVPPPLPPTLYSRTGDSLALIVILVTLAGIWVNVRRKSVASGSRAS